MKIGRGTKGCNRDVHGLLEWLIVKFSNGLTYPTKIHMDANIGRAPVEKSAKETQQLIENMATSNYRWPNKGSSH